MTFRTNIGQAIANNGWKDGDLLLVKWGYGRTADKVYVDTLTAGVGGDYQATLHQQIEINDEKLVCIINIIEAFWW